MNEHGFCGAFTYCHRINFQGKDLHSILHIYIYNLPTTKATTQKRKKENDKTRGGTIHVGGGIKESKEETRRRGDRRQSFFDGNRMRRPTNCSSIRKEHTLIAGSLVLESVSNTKEV